MGLGILLGENAVIDNVLAFRNLIGCLIFQLGSPRKVFKTTRLSLGTGWGLGTTLHLIKSFVTLCEHYVHATEVVHGA